MTKKRSFVPLVAGVVFAIVLAGFLAWRLSVLSTQPRALKDLYLEVTPPESIALAPDGSRLAYTASYGDETLLHLRRLDDGAVTRVAGTEGAQSPFFSPDGRRLGYYVGGAVRGLELESAAASRPAPAAADWIVAERGDDAVAAARVGDEERVLVRGARRPRYLAPGYLLFLRGGGLWAARYEPSEAKLVSEPFLAVEDVDGWYDASANGTLAFRRPGDGVRRRFAVILNWRVELERLAAQR